MSVSPGQRARYGCEDCGELWAKKSDVRPACRPWVIAVIRSPHTISGYEASDGEPVFA